MDYTWVICSELDFYSHFIKMVLQFKGKCKIWFEQKTTANESWVQFVLKEITVLIKKQRIYVCIMYVCKYT